MCGVQPNLLDERIPIKWHTTVLISAFPSFLFSPPHRQLHFNCWQTVNTLLNGTFMKMAPKKTEKELFPVI